MIRRNLINCRFSWFIYFFCLIISLAVLFQGRAYGVFGIPKPGMDQLNFLEHAQGLLNGVFPGQSYKLSPVYTVFLALASLVSGGNLLIIRILQVVLCSLIPVVIFKLALRLRCGFQASQAAALIYCFYGPAILMSIGILRAAPLALCFITFVYLLVRGFYSKKRHHYIFAGLLAGITVLGRENFIPVVFAPFIMLVFPVIRKRVRWRMAALYLAGIAILTIPMIMYNYARFGDAEIIPGNFAHIFKFYHGSEAVSSPDRLTSSIVGRIPSQIKMFASSYEVPNSLSFYAHREVITMLIFLVVPFNLLLGVALAALGLDHRRLGTVFVGGMAAGYFLTVIYFTLFYRFRIPDVPLLCVLCAVFLHALSSAKSRGKKYAAAFAVIFVMGFFWLTYTPPDLLRTGKERRATVLLLIINGEYSRAEQYMDKLVGDKIPLNNLDKYLITMLHESGFKDDAQRVFDKYLKDKQSVSPVKTVR